jgi:hypothetical protein
MKSCGRLWEFVRRGSKEKASAALSLDGICALESDSEFCLVLSCFVWDETISSVLNVIFCADWVPELTGMLEDGVISVSRNAGVASGFSEEARVSDTEIAPIKMGRAIIRMRLFFKVKKALMRCRCVCR